MAIRHYILATAGHVDHGKSALVRALTGIDPDRLPEEKKRGITIDLGFAHLDLPVPGGGADDLLRLGIVDVPGHEDFIKNMVAGVGAVDAALLAVAADDGWMPQTEEHVRILEYLGVTRLVVALTKADLAPSAEARAPVEKSVREHLALSVFADAPIIPTSLPTGTGLDELRAALARLLADAPPAADIGKPRLPIDRVFTLRGIGTVVTGTLIGGSLGRGQAVAVRPGSGQSLRIRAVQSHHRDVENAPPGCRVALNLPDLSADPKSPGTPRRGDVVTLPGIGDATETFDAAIFGRKASNRLSLKSGATVRIHLGSGHYTAQLHLPDSAVWQPGEGALAQVRLEKPALVFAGDRFVMRDVSGRETLAGGVALDPHATRRPGRRQAGAQRLLLAQRAEAGGNAGVFVQSALTRDQAVRRDGLLVCSRFAAREIDEALQRLAREGGAFLTPTLAADTGWWCSLHERAAAAVDAQHRAHPERAGLPLTQLRAAVTAGAFPRADGVFEALTADMATAHGFVLAGTSIRRAAHRPELPPRLLAAGSRVRAALLENPLEPPSRAVIAPDAATQAALRFLIEIGEAVELGEETVVTSGSFVRMRIGVVRHLRAHRSATASDLRQALGTTRRILVPLLERLDRDGITRRVGNERILHTV